MNVAVLFVGEKNSRQSIGKIVANSAFMKRCRKALKGAELAKPLRRTGTVWIPKMEQMVFKNLVCESGILELQGARDTGTILNQNCAEPVV